MIFCHASYTSALLHSILIYTLSNYNVVCSVYYDTAWMLCSILASCSQETITTRLSVWTIQTTMFLLFVLMYTLYVV